MRNAMVFVAVSAASAVVVAGVAGTTTVWAGDGGASDCGSVEGEIHESAGYTPYDGQRSHLPDAHLDPTGVEPPSVPREVSLNAVGDLPRQWSVVAADGSVHQYFDDEEVTEETTIRGFQGRGGIQLDAIPVAETGMRVRDISNAIGDRATPVQIGSSDGFVVWADPEQPGDRRLHHVYWEDDETYFALILDAPAEEAVRLARGIACR